MGYRNLLIDTAESTWRLERLLEFLKRIEGDLEMKFKLSEEEQLRLERKHKELAVMLGAETFNHAHRLRSEPVPCVGIEFCKQVEKLFDGLVPISPDMYAMQISLSGAQNTLQRAYYALKWLLPIVNTEFGDNIESDRFVEAACSEESFIKLMTEYKDYTNELERRDTSV